jgi:hypothetical protein
MFYYITQPPTVLNCDEKSQQASSVSHPPYKATSHTNTQQSCKLSQVAIIFYIIKKILKREREREKKNIMFFLYDVTKLLFLCAHYVIMICKVYNSYLVRVSTWGYKVYILCERGVCV